MHQVIPGAATPHGGGELLFVGGIALDVLNSFVTGPRSRPQLGGTASQAPNAISAFE
jgi:hypothetical protein